MNRISKNLFIVSLMLMAFGSIGYLFGFLNIILLKISTVGVILSVVSALVEPSLEQEISLFGTTCAEKSFEEFLKKMDKDGNYYQKESKEFDSGWIRSDMYLGHEKDDLDLKYWRKAQHFAGLYGHYRYVKTMAGTKPGFDDLINRIRITFLVGAALGIFLITIFWESDIWTGP